MTFEHSGYGRLIGENLTKKSISCDWPRGSRSAQKAWHHGSGSRNSDQYVFGHVSKIENGNTSASLTNLQALSRALGVPVTAFFRRFEEGRNAVFVKAGEGVDVERRGTRAGHQYNLLSHLGDGKAASDLMRIHLVDLLSGLDLSNRIDPPNQPLSKILGG